MPEITINNPAHSTPNSQLDDGPALRSLHLSDVGPAKDITYTPAERLNLLTGDNSLGKTFLLECMWWALTRSWLDYPALPRRSAPKNAASISFEIATQSGRISTFSSAFDWDKLQWKVKGRKEPPPGLVLYARSDGSFAIWDPVRSTLSEEDERNSNRGVIFLSRKDIWDGLWIDDKNGRRSNICNGLILDWAMWQTGPRYLRQWMALLSCLEGLSPADGLPLNPGELYTLPSVDAREMPTIKMPYDNVPVVHTSAGVQRILSLAYMLVWTWFKHLDLSSAVRKQPQRRIIVMIDEIEAHLHPKWQRAIIPAVVNVVARLSDAVMPQLHIATHSALVLASAETVFVSDIDELHHLKIEDNNAILETLPFVKRGTADSWLMSQAFGLPEARSFPGQQAIQEAERLQSVKAPSLLEVSDIHQKLIKFLAPDDEFWPTWNYFARQNGVRP